MNKRNKGFFGVEGPEDKYMLAISLLTFIGFVIYAIYRIRRGY